MHLQSKKAKPCSIIFSDVVPPRGNSKMPMLLTYALKKDPSAWRHVTELAAGGVNSFATGL